MNNISEKSALHASSLLSGIELLNAVKGEFIGDFDGASLFFASVATDSRNVVQNTLFVPLIGEKQDGHSYIPQALANGASVVFVAQTAFESDRAAYEALARAHASVAFIAVSNTLHALQAAAAAYVAHFPQLIRCAVTGSSGKTTSKELAVSILRQKYNVISNKGNLNSETGLPLSVFAIRSEHELGLFEMGMNRVDEIGEIAAVLKPNYAIITNIGTAHIGILGSREAIATEKKKCFRYLDSSGAAVVPADDDFADFLAKDVNATVIRYGCDDKISASLGVKLISDDGIEGTTFSVDGVTVHLSLPGVYNYKNALGAIALSRVLGVNAQQIKAGIESISALGARSRVCKGTYTILEDCYNANPDSMEKALDLCATASIRGKKLFVLGDMLELGAESVSAHEAAALQAIAAKPDMLMLVGAEMDAAYKKALAAGFPHEKLCYESAHDTEAIARVAEKIRAEASAGDFILLKGSRGMALERLLPLLEGEESA